MVDTLPQPSDSFRWVQGAPGPALVCHGLEAFAPHLITTRSWALAAGGRDDEGGAWAEVAAAIYVGPDRLVRAHQVHGAAVLVCRADTAPAAQLPDADILVSNDPTVAIAIQIADCVPILIADRRTGAVAAAHAGWRGLAAGVPRVAVGALAREFGSHPEDLVAAAGPSIRACCYEVGTDVHQRFEEAGWPESTTSRWFFTRAQPTPGNPSMAGVHADPRPGHWYFDSGCAARDQLESAGVPPDQILVAKLCTASHPGTLCSYRRDGAGAGRIGCAIRARAISMD
jgi:purine-nucleoside/S-methyl-5'-thioadenosine phosphorylase / adenosine deaminase